MASTEASGFSKIALALFILLLPLHALFLFLLTSWWNQVHDWPSNSELVLSVREYKCTSKKTTLFSHGSRKIEMNTCIKYHSYLKEGYGANMDDEDWNTDLPLCSSTKMNQLFHLTFQLNSTKVTSFKKSFVQCTKRSQQQPSELDISVCTKRHRGNSQSLKQLQGKTFG